MYPEPITTGEEGRREELILWPISRETRYCVQRRIRMEAMLMNRRFPTGCLLTGGLACMMQTGEDGLAEIFISTAVLMDVSIFRYLLQVSFMRIWKQDVRLYVFTDNSCSQKIHVV